MAIEAIWGYAHTRAGARSALAGASIAGIANSQRLRANGALRMRLVPALTLLAAVAGLCLHADASRGQSSGGPYQIPSQTIADGGGRSTGGRVQLEGTIGQNAVGDPATGGLYELIPGFRRERGPVVDGVFADGFEGD